MIGGIFKQLVSAVLGGCAGGIIGGLAGRMIDLQKLTKLGKAGVFLGISGITLATEVAITNGVDDFCKLMGESKRYLTDKDGLAVEVARQEEAALLEEARKRCRELLSDEDILRYMSYGAMSAKTGEKALVTEYGKRRWEQLKQNPLYKKACERMENDLKDEYEEELAEIENELEEEDE